MSLINEMLRDLQQQKDGQVKKQSRLQPKMMDRIPFLPKPVIVGGGALLLLCFVWWLSGVLSDAMFSSEPESQPEMALQAAQEEQDTTVPQVAVLVPVEEEPLTKEEREAEAPKAQPAAADSEKASQKGLAPAKVVAESPAREANPPASAKQPSLATKKAAAPAPRKVTVAKASQPERTLNKISTRPQPVVKSSSRLNPDQLPGAIATPKRSAHETQSLEPRPTKTPANTPYGMAEEAYLDGKWALARERSNLAIRSLQHALELYPGHLQARELLVNILSDKGKSGEAMFLLAEGLEIAPDYNPFKKKYANMLSEQGDYEAAVQVMLNGGLPSVTEDPESHVVLAALYQHLGEYFLAAQTYRNLIVAWPQTGAFWVGLGSALEGQKLSKDAVECYQRALETKNLRQDLKDFARKRLRLFN